MDVQPARSGRLGVTIDVDAALEAGELRDWALRLLAIGVGDHTPVEVQQQVAEIARRLAQLEPPAHHWR